MAAHLSPVFISVFLLLDETRQGGRISRSWLIHLVVTLTRWPENALNKIANNATRLLEGISYQLIVTLEYCHNLAEGQSLWLEYFGDVTVGGEVQVEVKDFAEDLTDGHINFWNTLKNWMSPSFKQANYSELILLTTQTYGAASKLIHWNQLLVQGSLSFCRMFSRKARSGLQPRKKSRLGLSRPSGL